MTFFHLARQFHRRGWLEVIFSTYPMFKLRGEGLPREKIRTWPWLHTLLLAKNRYGFAHGSLDKHIQQLIEHRQSRFIAKRIPDCEVFIALSSVGLVGGQITQSRGGRYVCERPSAHIQWANQCLLEEYPRWGESWPGMDPRAIEKELAEYGAADRIVVPSTFVKKTFLEKGIAAERLTTVPPGVDLGDFEKVGSPPKDRFVVIFVGAVGFRKGFPYLVEAFQKLRHPNKKLIVVGAVLRKTRDYLRSANLENVEFKGIVPYRTLKELYSRSHVLVLPSLDEGMARVQSEAMACGCPVIASENTGSLDLFKDGVEGFIVPIRDPAAIAERLERLCDASELRERMGENALLKVRSLGGWDSYGNGYAALCEELIGST